MPTGKDNYLETAIACLDSAQARLGRSVDQSDPSFLLARGLHLLAQGLLQQSHEVESRLISIEGQLSRS